MSKYRIRLFELILVLSVCVIVFTGCSDNEEDIPVQFRSDTDYRLARINIKNFGAVVFRLYPNEQPEAVNAFIELCKSGYFNGKPFYFMVEDYLVMGGDKEEKNRKTVKESIKDTMHPFKGALCLTYSSENGIELSDFYVVCMTQEKLADIEKLVELKGYTLSDYVKFGYKTELTPDELDLYRKYGGAPWLDSHTAVIGQAFEGMEVLDSVMQAFTDEEGKEIIINSIETD